MSLPGVAAAPRTGGVLWLAVTHCFLLPPPLAEAQATTSGAEDAGVLLEAKVAADTSACGGADCCDTYENGRWVDACPLDSWTPDTEPCGDGYDDLGSGWVGVKCDARGGRVVYVALAGTGVGGELLPFFGRLGALLVLSLSFNPALRGDVADLAGATELRYLTLQRCPLVVGEAAALAALVHLGEECSVCGLYGDDPGTGGLTLAGSGVHGPVAALRALPGLGADWGSDAGLYDFSPCSAFGGSPSDWPVATDSPGCGAAGLAPVAVRRNALCRPFALGKT